jgi:H+/Cl- antiporter ClcA
MDLTIDMFPVALRPLMRRFNIDFQPQRPPMLRTVFIATIAAVIGSLLADAILVKIGQQLFPSVANYQHFQFSDYSKLTVIGVLFACAGWPIVARISSQARKLFRLMAVLVTLVLLLPDAAIWYLGQPALGVFVLVWMHIAIAVVTYYSLVLISPVRRARHAR